MYRELFRYNHKDLTYIASAESFDDFTSPFPKAKSLWLCVAISKRSCKKVRGDIGGEGNKLDARLSFGRMGFEGVKMLYDLIQEFQSWIGKNHPKFLTVSPYTDDPWKRMRCYDRVLRRTGYVPYEVNDTYSAPIITYCRQDLGLDVPEIDVVEFLDEYYSENSFVKPEKLK